MGEISGEPYVLVSLQAAVREIFEAVGFRIKAQALVFIAEVPGELGPHDRARLYEVRMDSLPEATLEIKPGVKIDQREITKPYRCKSRRASASRRKG